MTSVQSIKRSASRNADELRDAIRSTMHELHLTDQDLAGWLGVDRSVINKCLNGKLNFYLHDLLTIGEEATLDDPRPALFVEAVCNRVLSPIKRRVCTQNAFAGQLDGDFTDEILAIVQDEGRLVELDGDKKKLGEAERYFRNIIRKAERGLAEIKEMKGKR